MFDPLPTSSRDSKLRNRAQAYKYLLGHLLAERFTVSQAHVIRANVWRANAERLAELLGRNFDDDLQNKPTKGKGVFDKIDQIVAATIILIEEHWLSQSSDWTADQRQRYAIFQLWLATIWPGHLAGCAGAVHNDVLKDALRENACCEIGAQPGSTGHVTLVRQFCISQGVTVEQMAAGAFWPEQARNMARMVEVVGQPEEFIAGYTYGSETFAAVMFKVFQPPFRLVGADMRYMERHVKVDGDEHSYMLRQAIQGMVSGGSDIAQIERGVAAAAQSRIEYLEYIQNGV